MTILKGTNHDCQVTGALDPEICVCTEHFLASMKAEHSLISWLQSTEFKLMNIRQRYSFTFWKAKTNAQSL